MPAAFVIILAVAVLGAATYFFTQPATKPKLVVPATARVESRTEDTAPETNTPASPSADTNETQLPAKTYQDGTYTGTGSYLTPARTNHTLAVTLTIENGTIVDSTIRYDDKDGYSNPNQERFDNAYREHVIGASLSEVKLSRVGAASLTSQAFNDAIVEITKEARVNG